MNSRRVLVTGASRGIGTAIAEAFARRGDVVAVHYGSSGDSATQTLQALEGSGHLLIQADMQVPSDIQRMAAQLESEWAGIDVLINNAGIIRRVDVFDDDIDAWTSAWQETLAINLLAPALLVRHLAPLMPPGGRILTLGSRAAFRGMPDSVMYAASKAGVTAMSQSLAQALAPRGIAVCTLAPGYVDTDMGRLVLDTDEGDAIRQQSPFNRVATPEEVAQAVLFLTDPAMEWASGAVLDFNGASHLRM